MSCCTDWPRKENLKLHDFYEECLLEPGWAGELTLTEARYIADELANSVRLRRAWGFRKRKRYPLTVIAQRAFPENPLLAGRIMRNQLEGKRMRAGGPTSNSEILPDAKLESERKGSVGALALEWEISPVA